MKIQISQLHKLKNLKTWISKMKNFITHWIMNRNWTLRSFIKFPLKVILILTNIIYFSKIAFSHWISNFQIFWSHETWNRFPHFNGLPNCSCSKKNLEMNESKEPFCENEKNLLANEYYSIVFINALPSFGFFSQKSIHPSSFYFIFLIFDLTSKSFWKECSLLYWD
jgi:hypothetical protein